MKEWKVPIQSLIDHIKTAIDVDDWAKEMAEDLLKEQEAVVRCKDCRFRDDPNSVISEWLPCQFARTPDDWFCACGRTVRENRTVERR